MLKTIPVSAAAIALSIIAWMLLPTTSEQAAAQSGSPYIVAVDLDIVPAEFDKFVELIKENGVATAKEPGCREFNVLVSAKEPHHVFLFEVYDNAAASEAHRATDHFKKYQAATANMVAKREVRVMSPIAMHSKAR